MSPREFFYCVANMRQAQRQYFSTHNRSDFLRCRACENEVDREINRVKAILASQEQEKPGNPW